MLRTVADQVAYIHSGSPMMLCSRDNLLKGFRCCGLMKGRGTGGARWMIGSGPSASNVRRWVLGSTVLKGPMLWRGPERKTKDDGGASAGVYAW